RAPAGKHRLAQKQQRARSVTMTVGQSKAARAAFASALIHYSVSKHELECNLHLPGVSGFEYLPGCSLADRRIWIPQVRVIECVERLPAELQVLSFAKRKLLHQSEIGDMGTGPVQNSDTRVAKQIRPRSNEGAGIEPQIGAWIRDCRIAYQVG